MVIPGARYRNAVVRKFTAPMMLEALVRRSPMIHRSTPKPGVYRSSDRGA
jgi:hypothetical protein